MYQGRSGEPECLTCGWCVGQGQCMGPREDGGPGLPEKSEFYILVQNFLILKILAVKNSPVLGLAHERVVAPLV